MTKNDWKKREESGSIGNYFISVNYRRTISKVRSYMLHKKEEKEGNFKIFRNLAIFAF